MYTFKLRTKTNAHNFKNYLTNTKVDNLVKINNSNFNFNTHYNKNIIPTPCDSCPKNDIPINHKNFTLDNFKNELTNKNMELSNGITNQPCKKCRNDNIICFRIKTENEKFIYYSNPSIHLDVDEDYHFEEITILNKDDKYILLDKNMITNNSKQKLTIEMNSEFYNNIRLPLILTSKCILHKSNKYFHVKGFIL